MNRVEVTRLMVGIDAMQVCTEEDATDEEILQVCNAENPSGTTNGWTRVFREVDENLGKECLPTPCLEYPNRTHFLVFC